MGWGAGGSNDRWPASLKIGSSTTTSLHLCPQIDTRPPLLRSTLSVSEALVLGKDRNIRASLGTSQRQNRSFQGGKEAGEGPTSGGGRNPILSGPLIWQSQVFPRRPSGDYGFASFHHGRTHRLMRSLRQRPRDHHYHLPHPRRGTEKDSARLFTARGLRRAQAPGKLPR